MLFVTSFVLESLFHTTTLLFSLVPCYRDTCPHVSVDEQYVIISVWFHFDLMIHFDGPLGAGL